MERIPMTAEGHAALQTELKNLKSVERPNIIAAIAEARAHGDLSENAEYHAAKEKQSFIEAKKVLLQAQMDPVDCPLAMQWIEALWQALPDATKLTWKM